jgi:two-component system sensor histidine kinase/response regulator
VTLDSSVEASSIFADEDLLRRLLANLVDNAVRHAPARSVVRVAVRVGASGVDIRVTDLGAGVPPDMRAGIFDAFVQLEGEGRPRTRAGRGLGLTFCKLVAESHGGKIWIEDASPGAVFCVSIPDAG